MLLFRYLYRVIIYAAIFFAVFSVGYTLMLRVVPVTLTPLKVKRFFEGIPSGRVAVRSNWVPLNEINMSMVRAVIASEDNHFMTHSGFDWEQIDIAIEHNRRGRKVRGASTISQQTAKNVFCTPARTWFRKGVETYYTVLIEALWSKRRIMEVYLNIIETGRGMYGVEAPARRVWKKHASDLNRHEASMIATVLPWPTRMNLFRPSSYVVRRSERIRRLMNNVPVPDFDNPANNKPADEVVKRPKWFMN